MLSDVVTVIEPPGALDGPSRSEPLPQTTVGDEGAGLELCGAGNPEGTWVAGAVVVGAVLVGAVVVGAVVIGAEDGAAGEAALWIEDAPPAATIGFDVLVLANPCALVGCGSGVPVLGVDR